MRLAGPLAAVAGERGHDLGGGSSHLPVRCALWLPLSLAGWLARCFACLLKGWLADHKPAAAADSAAPCSWPSAPSANDATSPCNSERHHDQGRHGRPSTADKVERGGERVSIMVAEAVSESGTQCQMQWSELGNSEECHRVNHEESVPQRTMSA